MKTQRTDQKRTVRWLSTVLLFGAMLTMMLPAGAWAFGTASNTTITNQVTIGYQVGTVAQTPITDSASFVVDDLVDLAVTTLDGAIVDVSPGATAMVLRFRLDNEGNTTHDFLLSAVDQATGSSYVTPFGSLLDSFDADTGINPVRIYLDETPAAATSGYTPGTWSGSGLESAVTYVDELPADESVTLYIVIDIPAGQSDGDMSIHGLLAQVAAGGGAGAQGAAIASDDSGSADTAGVDIVFGDGVGADDPNQTNPDGYHSSRSVFRIASATLAASKTSQVISDPFSTSNPKAIPGAVVQYTITVDNTGGTAASNVVITDPIMLMPDVTFVSGSASAANNEGTVTPVIEYSTGSGTPMTWSTSETSPVNYIRVTHSSIRATDGQGTLVFQVTINN
jgi:uncharacterized repeat protein (TIGR01451 family)